MSLPQTAPNARQVSHTLRASAAFQPIRVLLREATDSTLEALSGDRGLEAQRRAALKVAERELAAAVAVELLPCGRGDFLGLVQDESRAQMVERLCCSWEGSIWARSDFEDGLAEAA